MSRKLEDVLPDAVVHALLESVDPIQPDTSVADRISNKLFGRIAAEGTAGELLTVPGDSGDWVETAPGNSVKVLRRDSESVSMLVRLEAGATFPAHSHPADEETYVLEGDTLFGDIPLSAGDYHLAPAGTSHGEVTSRGGCLLLIRMASDS